MLYNIYNVINFYDYIIIQIGNACGTVGLLHAIGNAQDKLVIQEGSYLDRFYKSTSTMTPDQIAAFLNDDPEIEETHEAAASEGQTEAVMDVETHFICFR